MSKQIKITLLDKKNLKFQIEEVAQPGDFFFLDEHINISLENLNYHIETYLKQAWFQEQNTHWKTQLEKEKLLIKKATESTCQEDFLKTKNSLEHKIEQLNAKLLHANSNTEQLARLSAAKAQGEKEAELKFKHFYEEQIKSIKEQHNKFISSTKEEITNFYTKEIKELKEKNQAQQSQINHLNKHYLQSSKILGQELENKIFQEIQNYFDCCQTVKYTREYSIDKIRLDFLLSFLKEKNISDTPGINFNVAIECKAECPDSKNKTKNKEHHTQILNNAKKTNSIYAILITELEPNSHLEIEFTNSKNIDPKAPIYLFTMRPKYLISFLKMLNLLNNKINEMHSNASIENQNFQIKNNILEIHEEFKQKVLGAKCKSIFSTLVSIQKNITDIQTSASKILDEALLDKIRNHVLDFEFKFDKLSPQVIKKIEKASSQLDPQDLHQTTIEEITEMFTEDHRNKKEKLIKDSSKIIN